MKKFVFGMIIVVFASMLFFNPCSAHAEIVQGDLGESPWVQASGDMRLTPAYPDTVARYDEFLYKQHTRDFDILKLTGEFPHARYFSFNIYDISEGLSVVAMLDSDIEPDEGSVNPYRVGVDRDASNRSFTIWVVKEGIAAPAGSNNVIEIPANIENVCLMTRAYRADEGLDSYGGTTPPAIEALKADLTSGESPESMLLHLDEILSVFIDGFLNESVSEFWNNSQMLYGDDIVFHRFGLLGGLFPTAHNQYMMAPITQNYANKVAVLTFLPPTFEDTYTGGDMEGGKDVRYWSVCLGDWGTTGTTNCIVDDEAVKNPDGSVTICIAPLYMKGIIENAGLNYMRWGAILKPLLIHRHMLADESFAGAIGNVPEIGHPPVEGMQEYYDENMAVNFIGDYCPTGKVYTILEFKNWLKSR